MKYPEHQERVVTPSDVRQFAQPAQLVMAHIGRVLGNFAAGFDASDREAVVTELRALAQHIEDGE